MKDLELFDNRIRIDDDAFINITDMWRASGGDNKNRPKYFLENEQTKAFIDELESKGGIPPFRIVRGGKKAGTWVHKLVAYKYASWISPAFEIATYEVLDKFFSGELKPKDYNDRLQDWARRSLACNNKGSFHGRGLALHKKVKNNIHEEGEKLMDEVQIKINFKLPS